MLGRKRPRRIQLPHPPGLEADLPSLDFSQMSQFGPSVPVLAQGDCHLPALDLERDWRALGELAWTILARRRMQDILPCHQVCEFERYVDLLHRSSGRYLEEIFIGLEYGGCRPMFVPRWVFERHAYVLGGTGSGKTSHALAQILIQLAEPYTDAKDVHHDAPPILIIDMKQNGDRYLRALAERLAENRGQKLRFFSIDPDYESLVFDPLYCLRHVKYPLKLLETLLKAFSMIYPEGYGSDFFTNEQRVQLMEILYQERPQTMDQLIQFIRTATRGKSGNTDARGLYSALAALQHAMHVHTDGSPLDDEKRIDFDRFFERREIFYVHLDSRSMSLLSRDIGKLLLFALLETASQREKDSRKVQAFAVIDEFHRLAARNIVEMLEDARSAGLGFIIAHQSSSSLVTRDADLYGTLFENCSFKQCLTLEDERVIKLFQLIAGRIAEIRRGGSLSRTSGSADGTGSNYTQGESWGNVSGSSGLESFSSESHGISRSHGQSESHSENRSRTDGTTWKEEMVSRLLPEMIAEVNNEMLLALVHVKGAGSSSLTSTGGIPVLVQGLFPFTEPVAMEMMERPWPRKETQDAESYYRSARPRVALHKLAEVAGGAGQSRPAPDAPHAAEQDQALAPAPAIEWNEGEERQLKGRISTLAERLAEHMTEEAITVQRFARQNQVTVKEVLRLARLAGIDLRDKESVLDPQQVKALKSLLAPPPPGTKKDNGPQ